MRKRTDPRFKNEPLRCHIVSHTLVQEDENQTHTTEVDTPDLFLTVRPSEIDTTLREVVDGLRVRGRQDRRDERRHEWQRKCE